MSDQALDPADIAEAVPDHGRFPAVTFRGAAWDLSHLNPFGFRTDIGRDESTLPVDVVVFFSCHCFTRGEEKGERALLSELYDDGREVRVLCPERYELSRRFFPKLVQELSTRHIRMVSDRPNFLTFEVDGDGADAGLYVVYFEAYKDNRRRKRLILRVQSAYKVQSLSKREDKAKKVGLAVLLRHAYEGKPLKA